MKYYPTLVIVFLLSLSACDKDDPSPLEEKTADEVVKEEITAALTAESDLSDFIAVFAQLEMEPKDVEEGITVFAPANNTGDPNGRSQGSEHTQALTPEALQGHIVKGLIPVSNLEDGDTLRTLNGKLLIVEIDGEEIRINGTPVTAKDLASDAEYVIHKVQETLQHPVTGTEPASIVVRVWNTVEWSAENPNGLPESGVDVFFYAAREDYPNGNPVFIGETDDDGRVVFSTAEAGKSYFIVAQENDLSNIFYRSAQPVNGTYTGMIPAGIFQTSEEVQASAVQSDAAPGNFRWVDLNADGIINGNDSAPVPHLEVKPVFSQTEVEVLIGYGNNDATFIRDGEDALRTLEASRNILNTFHKNLVMADGMLSDDAECGAATNWCPIDNFAFNSTHPVFFQLWNDGYNAIFQFNMLMRDVPFLTFAEKEAVLAEAKGMRAYVYLQLFSYFGDIPLTDDVALEPTATRNTRDEVLSIIQSDLEHVASQLPASHAGNPEVLSANAAKGLLARVALLQQDFTSAATLTSELLQNSSHALMESTDNAFISRNTAEIIWDFSSSLPPGFSEYFHGRTFCPALRLPEVYLINAEANIELGNLGSAGGSIEIIRNRDGMAPMPYDTQDDLRLALMDTWKVAMSREGSRFFKLVSWHAAIETLGAKGYDDMRHSLLPIPQAVIDKHMNLLQNPGY